MKIDNALIKKIALVAAGCVILNWLLYNTELVGKFFSTAWAIIFPFILGFIFAFLLNLPMRAVEKHLLKNYRRRGKRVLSFLITILLVLLFITLIIVLVIPQLVDTVGTLAKSMPGYLRSWQEALKPYEEYIPTIQEWVQNLDIDWQKTLEQLTGILQSGAGSVLSSAVGVATSIVNGFVSFFVGIIFTAYLLLDKEHLTAQLQGLMKAYIPEKRYDKIVEVAGLVNHNYTKFISGQCMEAGIIMLIYIVCLTVGRFEYPLLIAIIIGLFSLIPLVGVVLGCAIGAFLLLVSMGFWRTVTFLIMAVILQQIEGNFIYPRIVGSSMGLPPIWSLLAVMVGGGLGGIFGALFFMPLFSVLYTLLHRHASKRLTEKGIESPVSQLPAPPPKKERKPFKNKNNKN